MATEQPLSDPVTALVHETPTAPMDDAVAESPPLQAAEPMREPTLVQPASPTAAALAQVAESERTIPYSDVHAAPTIVPSAQIARDVEHWHRATRQWRAMALAMTVLALCLGGFVATLRNFPERLPPSVRAQFSALAAMPGDIFRIRRAAPPESQFDE